MYQRKAANFHSEDIGFAPSTSLLGWLSNPIPAPLIPAPFPVTPPTLEGCGGVLSAPNGSCMPYPGPMNDAECLSVPAPFIAGIGSGVRLSSRVVCCRLTGKGDGVVSLKLRPSRYSTPPSPKLSCSPFPVKALSIILSTSPATLPSPSRSLNTFLEASPPAFSVKADMLSFDVFESWSCSATCELKESTCIAWAGRSSLPRGCCCRMECCSRKSAGSGG
mmetsp:Transcript_28705/g.71854  ORF Transcript_28705/g.71854 Transcript_28705/m.71854 type:complete len:220 (+) Transcript_28705:168-827(+)